MPNPYIYGSMVTQPAMFFGRTAELDTIRTRLRAMQSTSIVGLRRIGKSSLLYQLSQTLRNELGPNYRPLYISLQDARFRTVTGFVQQVAMKLNAQTGGTSTANNVTDMSSFSAMIENLNNQGIRPVLCLDEFEEFMQHSHEFNNDFLEALRSLGTIAHLAIVTTSQTPLVDLIRYRGLTSPFYNIFSEIELGLLELDAAQSLWRDPFKQEQITLSPEDEALLQKLGGRHPFYLQMACDFLYKALSQSPSARADTVRDRFSREAEPHFEHLWEHLKADEQIVLRVVDRKAIPTGEDKKTLKRLERLGVVEHTQGNWHIFSAIFAERVWEYPIRQESAPVPQPGDNANEAVDRNLLWVTGILFILMFILLAIGLAFGSAPLVLLAVIPAGILLFLILECI